MSRVLGDDHHKRFTDVLCHSSCSTAIWPWAPRMGQNLHPFPGYGDVSKWVKNSRVGRKPPNKRKIEFIIMVQWNFDLLWKKYGSIVKTMKLWFTMDKNMIIYRKLWNYFDYNGQNYGIITKIWHCSLLLFPIDYSVIAPINHGFVYIWYILAAESNEMDLKHTRV